MKMIESNKKRMMMNTQKAYASDLAYIQQWGCVTFENFAFPMSESAVLHFITDHLQEMAKVKEKQLMSPILRNGYKAKSGLHSLATVRRRLSALAKHHKTQGYEDPCGNNKIKQLIRTIAKTGEKNTSKKAITKDVLENLLIYCDNSVKGARDKAILLLTWTTGGRRRSEITAAQLEQLTNVGNDFSLHIPIHSSKKNHALEVPIIGRPAQALRDWMTKAGIRQGFIFRSVNKSGKVSDKPLSPIDINRVVKNYCRKAGLDEKQFGAHSLRKGFLLEQAAVFNWPIGQFIAH